MLSLVGRVAAASASGALRGLSPSASLPQAQLLLRATPAAVQPGKCVSQGAVFISPCDLEPGPVVAWA
jgi:F-type H+-transporting ATPase subunit beta